MREVCYPNLRAEMARRGITQQYLADRVGLSANYFCDKMNGKRPFKLDDLRSIADELNMSIDYLFAEKEAV